MTPQEVIKTFMATLANRDYTYSTSPGKEILNTAVKASSRFLGIQNAIDNMKADQLEAEREAVEEVMGSDYAGKTLSDISSKIQKADVSSYATEKFKSYLGNYNTTTVANAIKERKAHIFLEKYCGIQLQYQYGLTSNGSLTYRGTAALINSDTGAITGSDANITLAAGDVVYGTTLTSADLQRFARQNGTSLQSDGSLILGTGVEKTAKSVVPEIGNKYTSASSTAQSISTGTNDWLVVATSASDTIITGGADSIDAGAGNDRITVGADYASILTGAGSDTVAVAATVNNVTFEDLSSTDTLTINGTFSIGSAQVEDTILVVKDKTGNRQLRIDNYADAKNAKVNGVDLSTWLSRAGFNIDNLESTSTANVPDEVPTLMSAMEQGSNGQVEGDKFPTEPAIYGDAAEETQNISSGGSNVVDLSKVTITGGTVTAGSTTLGTISSEFPDITSFTKNGLTINLLGVSTDTGGNPSKIQTKTLAQLTDDQKTIVAGLFKWWAKEAIRLNEESYNFFFDSDNSTSKSIGLFLYDSKGKGSTLAAVWGAGYSNAYLSVNMNYYTGIAEDNVDGQSSGTSGYLDRTLAHEFNHAIMGAHVKYFHYLPQFITEGMAELTHGIDDFRATRIFEVAYDSSRLNKALDISNTGTGNSDSYAGGYMFLRYFAKQAALQLLVDYANPDAGEVWEISKTTATCKIDGEVVATISGLKSGLVTRGNLIDGITLKDGVITVSQKVLDTTKVTLKGDGYTLALDDDLTNNPITISNKKWTVKSGTATLKGDKSAGYTLAADGKTITYSVAKTNQTVATVTGLAKKGITADDFSIDSNVITLKDTMLGTSKITVKGDGYTLALDDSFNPQALSPYWAFSGTTATYEYDTSAGFKLSDDAKAANYIKKTSTALATISGLKKGLKITDGSVDGVTLNGSTITLNGSALGTSKVTLKGDGYTLALADDVPQPVDESPYWAFSGTTATYKYDTSATFSLTQDGKTVDYVKKTSSTLATITGLKKGLKAVDGSIDGITIDGNTITLDDKVLATSNIKVKGGDYTLALASNKTSPETEVRWQVSKTTANYSNIQNAYFAPSTDNKTLTYKKEKTLTNYVTVNGLAKGALVDENGSVAGITLNNKTVTLSGDESFGKTVTVKLADGYTLDNQLTAPQGTDFAMTVKNGTATIKQSKTAGYTLTTNKKTGVHTLAYSAEKSGKKAETLATITGLNKSLVDTNGSLTGLSYDTNTQTVALDKRVLGTSDIKLKGDYTLVPVTSGTYAIPTATKTDTIWAVNGTKAIYKTVDIGYFTLKDDKTLKHTKEVVHATHATVSGIKSNASPDSLSLSGNTITITKDALVDNPTANTKITLGKNDSYSLQLGGDIAIVEYNSPSWTYASGKATYSAEVRTAGYSVANTGKTITYVPATTGKKQTPTIKTFAKLSGVRSASGIFVGSDTITLSEAALNSKKVTLTSSEGYKLALSSNVPTPTLIGTQWSTGSTTANLTGKMSAGYTVTNDNTISYSKVKNTTLATIKGLASKTTELDVVGTSDRSITLSGEQLSKKVTISGDYSFNFREDFNDASIVASAANDTITCAGSGLSITGGKGDDYIDFGAGGNGNVFLYATGDGNDVIADFTASKDKVKVTKGKSILVKSEGRDVVITVDTGTIKLQGVAGQNVSIINKNGVEQTFPTTVSADLLDSDNFLTSDVRLDAITDNALALDDLNTTTLNANDLTTLTKQSSLITYGSKK